MRADDTQDTFLLSFCAAPAGAAQIRKESVVKREAPTAPAEEQAASEEIEGIRIISDDMPEYIWPKAVSDVNAEYLSAMRQFSVPGPHKAEDLDAYREKYLNKTVELMAEFPIIVKIMLRRAEQAKEAGLLDSLRRN